MMIKVGKEWCAEADTDTEQMYRIPATPLHAIAHAGWLWPWPRTAALPSTPHAGAQAQELRASSAQTRHATPFTGALSHGVRPRPHGPHGHARVEQARLPPRRAPAPPGPASAPLPAARQAGSQAGMQAGMWAARSASASMHGSNMCVHVCTHLAERDHFKTAPCTCTQATTLCCALPGTARHRQSRTLFQHA